VSLSPTLAGALAGIFGTAPAGSSTGNVSSSGGSVTTIPTDVRNDIAAGLSYYQQAQAALTAGNLGTYQSDTTKAGNLLQQANALLAASSATKSGGSSTRSHASAISGVTLRSPGAPAPSPANA
jgi:hypothetical protein